MSDGVDFIREVWREVYVILQDLADGATARGIVGCVCDRVQPDAQQTNHEKNKQRTALIEAVRDACVAHLLRLARHDLSIGKPESRAVCLLLRFFEPQIRAAVRRRISHAEDVEDVVNNVRMRVWRCLGSFEGERGQLHKYIETACWHACVDLYRGIPEGEQLCDPRELVGPCLDDSRLQSVVEWRMFLRDSLPLLPPNDRQAVEAFLTFDSWLEAERALGIPRQTLASRFRAACRRLLELFERQ